MFEYRAPVNDAMFALRHVGELDELSKTERFGHADTETVRAVLEEHGRFFAEVWGPLNTTGDREGLRLDDGVVTLPEGFAEAYAKFVEAGWQGLNAPIDYGGAGFPEVVFAVGLEFMTAANGSLTMCPGLTIGAIEALATHGSEEQKERYLRHLVTGEWAATMNLTEPQAGSDVGQCTTRAEPQEDGSYLITGTKIFISFGDHELTENIVHLVLARTPGAPPGTKGISMFLVPKYLVGPDGSLGERNDVTCVSLEHKMGIHASPTCVLSYGDAGGAVGYLVGAENAGMRAMFTMMNSSRLAVAIQGAGIGDAAYQKALAYSQERRQGRKVGSDSHEPALIAEHPDVRRMLMSMRSNIEAMRLLIVYTAAAIDFADALTGEDATAWQEIADLMTPVSKAWCTDTGIDVTSTAVQVFGGMGYVEETGVAQHFRDMRIGAIYEGTNGIQAMDLVGRKLPMRMGGVVNEHLQRMRDIDGELADAGPELAAIRESLPPAIDALASATSWIFDNGLTDPREALAGATPYLRMFGTVTCGWLMARQALAARAELASGATDRAYLEAKVATAEFFATQTLPLAAGLLPAVTAGAAPLFAVEPASLSSI